MQTLFGKPKIALSLHLHIELRCGAGKSAEPQRHIGRQHRAAIQHRVQGRTGYFHTPGCRGDGQFHVLIENFPHQFARVRRSTCERACGGEFSHGQPLMILLKVYPAYLGVFPFECDAPRLVYVDRVALRPSAQSMKVKTGLPQVIERASRVERIEANQGSAVQVAPDASRSPGLEELFEAAVSEGSDHRPKCKV